MRQRSHTSVNCQVDFRSRFDSKQTLPIATAWHCLSMTSAMTGRLDGTAANLLLLMPLTLPSAVRYAPQALLNRQWHRPTTAPAGAPSQVSMRLQHGVSERLHGTAACLRRVMCEGLTHGSGDAKALRPQLLLWLVGALSRLRLPYTRPGPQPIGLAHQLSEPEAAIAPVKNAQPAQRGEHPTPSKEFLGPRSPPHQSSLFVPTHQHTNLFITTARR